MTRQILFLIPLLLVTGIGLAHAEPLDEVMAEILEFNDNSADVKISWNQDDSASQYEIGCVSCSPNVSEITVETSIVLNGVTPIGDKSTVLLYVIAYDSNGEVASAEQVFVKLN